MRTFGAGGDRSARRLLLTARARCSTAVRSADRTRPTPAARRRNPTLPSHRATEATVVVNVTSTPKPSLEIYGFAMLDIGHDFKQIDPNWSDTLRVDQAAVVRGPVRRGQQHVRRRASEPLRRQGFDADQPSAS